MTAEEKEKFNGYVRKLWHARHSDDIAKILIDFREEYAQQKQDKWINVAAYWEERCKLAEKLDETSPCDPDITTVQIEAHSKYNGFMASFPTPPID